MGKRRTNPIGEYEIECGQYRGKVRARTIGNAWRKLTRGGKSGFAKLARFKCPNIPVWQYTTPHDLDQCP